MSTQTIATMNAVTPEQISSMFAIQQSLDDYIEMLVVHVEALWESIRFNNTTRNSISSTDTKEAYEIDNLLEWHKRDRDDEDTLRLFGAVSERMYNIVLAKLARIMDASEIDTDRACRHIHQLARLKEESNSATGLRRAIFDANTGAR